MSEIENDFNDYTNRFGLLTEWKNPGGREADNGLCHTAAKILCYSLRGEDTAAMKIAFSYVIDACEVPGHPGLYNRSPNIHSQIGWDDLIAVAYAWPPAAKRMLDYGRAGARVFGPIKVPYVYNNEQPGKITWAAFMGRNPSLIAHLHHAAGEKPPFWTRLLWAWSLKHSGTPADQDPWKLTRFLIASAWPAARLYKWENDAVFKWFERFKEAWPGGFKDLYAKYYEAGASYPLSKWWPV